MSPRNHSVPLAESQHHVINPTNPRGALDDGVEDRLHVRGRAADDAEHLGRRRLMLQGLAQFCVALLEFLEQPHVLDRDDRLIGEGFEKRDLLVGKRTNLRTTNRNSSNSISFAQERRNNDCTCASNFVNNLGLRKFRVNLSWKVVNMNCLAIENCPT